ncbi:MAG: heme-degrading domain-containing protein [Micrococcales bacterium]
MVADSAELQQKLTQSTEKLAGLALKKFDLQDAWQLGTILRELATERSLPIVIDIRQVDTPLFSVMLPGATTANFDWARRKRNLVLLVGESSWQISLKTALGTDYLALMDLPGRDFTPHGGCVPIRVEGVEGIVATVTISGLPQEQDHELAVEGLSLLSKSQRQ